MHQWMILLFFFFFILANSTQFTGEISINCGSTQTSPALDGREWLGDNSPNFTIKGLSTGASVARELIITVDPIPYKTARISRSQFSYIFQGQAISGQKLIRLHFHPNSYNGFIRSKDLFTVEAGPFTLLSNFSASITADALAVNYFVKEFCFIIEENQPLNITFSPAPPSGRSKDTHAFVNGIDIISVPETLSYCHTGDIGIPVVGHKSLAYIDNSTALEMVHRRNVKSSPGYHFRPMFWMWSTVINDKAKLVNDITWRISVDVGFRYLVRFHFCQPRFEMAESSNKGLLLLIDHIVMYSNTKMYEERDYRHSQYYYRNYIVMAKGRKQAGKRDILITLQSKDRFSYGHGPLEGFEIFKLSNDDNSLASPNPLPPTRQNAPFWTIQDFLSVLGRQNTIATAVAAIACLVNIIVHMLRQLWEVYFPKQENKPSTRATQVCRHFSLAELLSATKNFNEAFVIGKGGFGKVYKGLIDNGQETVAIKRLKPYSKQGKREFWTEIETISKLRHFNLVSLIGYCNEQQEMILVYEYMPNGTIADHLYKLARKNSNYSLLSWEERLKICIGAGRGLDYLHTGQGVIHRDVKSSNVLLDETFVAKVSDFGLAKTENLRVMQSQDSTNLKGTFGYIDPDYFRTRKLTTKSDTYSFGVVLLEVLCGRPAVDRFLGEDERSLTMWVRDNISRGQIDQIVAPSLRGEISPNSLMAFVGIVEKCLHDEPKKRPTIAHVVINLEFALEEQNSKSLSANNVATVASMLPSIDKTHQEHAQFMVPNEITSVAVVLQSTDKTKPENVQSLLPNEVTGVADLLPCTDRTILSTATSQLNKVSSDARSTFVLKEKTSSRMIQAEPNYGKRDSRKSIMHKLSRLWPWDTARKREKPSKRMDSVGVSKSAPITKYASNKTSSRGSILHQKPVPTGVISCSISVPNFRIFTFSELKVATRNFRPDSFLGEGGFGRVYKGVLEDKSTNNNGYEFIAIKRLNPEGMQGFNEWLSEVNFLGRLSHPNLVKLLGYCLDDKELLLVYEYMQKGGLESHLFRKGPAQTLSWNLRLKILNGAARGLAYLHALDAPIIHRDLKSSNILLDGSYNAKLADFGLAKLGPSAADHTHTHVSTRVMGTFGYAAPEYIATGHLYVKSDVYSFGVVLLETLSGLRAHDKNRPSGQQNLVACMKPDLKNRRKLVKWMDSRLDGRYSRKAALQVCQLAKRCLELDPKARPSMDEVVEILESIDLSDEEAREPRVHFSHHQIGNPLRK